MCRRADPIVHRTACALAFLLVALGAGTAARAADELAAYLERLGLSSLLASHLERRLTNELAPDERQRIVDRLAEVYPQLLASETDDARRQELVERSERLLEHEQPAEPDVLRVALLRVRYRSAAKVAEDDRVALASDDAVARAIQDLTEVATACQELRPKLEQRSRDLERRGDRVGGFAGDEFVERADAARAHVQETLSLEGWSDYYRSALAHDRRIAELAQPLFAKILDTGEAFPDPKDVSVDLRSNDLFAGAILGMALATSRTESLPTALAWLKLLEEPNVPEAIRKQLPAWRLAACAERGEWDAAREELKAILAMPQPPIAWLRLAAVSGLRGQREGERSASGNLRDATALAREAITALASRRELSQIADLARRFGSDAIGDRGFAAMYVRGVRAYEDARAAKERNDPSAAAGFAAAGAALEAALREADAIEFGEAVIACRTLAGWSAYEAGDAARAFALFSESAEESGGRDEEAEWMALVTLEDLVEAEKASGKESPRAAELSSRIDAFIARHPSSDRVPQLLGRRSAIADLPRREDLERLLAMDDSAKGAAAAKRQALAGLYRLFRAATDSESRAEIGRRFLLVLPKLGPASRSSPFASLPAGDVALNRQALEIAAHPDVADIAFATATLQRFDELGESGAFDLAPITDELLYRKVQVALLSSSAGDALARLSDLELRAPNGPAADAARRAIFRWASDQIHAESTPDRRAAIAAALRTGESIIAGAAISEGTLAKALKIPMFEGVAQTTFEAGSEAYLEGGDRATGERMLALGRALREARPRDASLLEGIAAIAAPLGERTLADECLHEVVNGSSIGSERWYRAKCAWIALLAETDPERARAILAQHVQLQPNYGPPPFGDRLRALEALLGGPSPSPPPPPPSPNPSEPASASPTPQPAPQPHAAGESRA